MIVKEREHLKYVGKKNILYSISSFLLFYFGFKGKVSLYTPDCSETCYIAQIGYKLMIHLGLSLLTAGIIGRYHYAQCHTYIGRKKGRKKGKEGYGN